MFDAADAFLFTYAQKLLSNSGARITLMDMNGNMKNEPGLNEPVKELSANWPGHILVLEEIKIERKMLQQFDLMLISVDGWKKLLLAQSGWLNQGPSHLILKP